MYELWDVSVFSEGEPPMPLTKEFSHEEFSKVYLKFLERSKKIPCVIIYEDGKNKNHSGNWN